MRFTFLVVILFGLYLKAPAQIYEPVKWNFKSIKLDDNTYNIYLKATIQPGWHVYSHIQPKDAIAQPLRIKFNRNPLAYSSGKAIELGKLEKYFDKETKVRANQYSNTLDVRQTVKVKGSHKTKFSGTLTYQTCNDERCLPPEDVEFEINLN